MKATAIAHSNIALVKYWGKRDEKLILPQNSSISMTLDELFTTTTAEYSEEYKRNHILINEIQATEKEAIRINSHLELIKSIKNYNGFFKISTKNNFPKKAGLASSASGSAALSLAATSALNLELSKSDLSIIARRGSGSASRSIHGGFVKWNRGEHPDGRDSLATQLGDINHWPELTMIVTVLSLKEKKVSSRAGMKQTVKTSPLYPMWLNTIEDDLKTVEQALIDKNFQKMGSTVETNALKMHSTMHTTNPPIIYWEADSLLLMKKIISLREDSNIPCYFTMDAGPQVKILTLDKYVDEILENIQKKKRLEKYYICHTGKAAHTTEKHLF